MTQEEKQLLIQDLSARLPYKPRVRYYYNSIGCAAINGYSDEGYLSYKNLEDFSIYPKYGLEKTRVYNILPYLRPMSSMTEEESLKYVTLTHYNTDDNGKPYRELTLEALDWLNSHHFDYRGLIEKGLALEATEGMYNAKTE